MDAYFGYNQIPMFGPERKKIAFVIEQANYQHIFLPFGLKNVDATYQAIMNKVFQKEIGETLEVYMDDMIVNFGQEEIHDQHLQ